MRRLPLIPFCSSLKIRPLCHTLSNALEISRNTLLTSRPSSKDFSISCVIDKSWLIQESPGLKPDWFGDIYWFGDINWHLKLIIVDKYPSGLTGFADICNFRSI